MSAGEAQRLSLVRALYRAPAVLLLDDPVSMFDEREEVAFVRQAREALLGTTIVLATQRVEVLMLADRVVGLAAPGPLRLMESGEVIEGPWGKRPGSTE